MECLYAAPLMHSLTYHTIFIYTFIIWDCFGNHDKNEETKILLEYQPLSYNLSGLANQNQALRQNTSRYFIPKMSVFNTSKVLCNSHVMFVYVIIVHNCWRSLLWRSLLLTFAFIMDELQSTYIHLKNLFLLPLIVYRVCYDEWKSNSCRIIQLYHVLLINTGDILVIFWYFFLYSTRLEARGIQKKYQKIARISTGIS